MLPSLRQFVALSSGEDKFHEEQASDFPAQGIFFFAQEIPIRCAQKLNRMRIGLETDAHRFD
jgi:hypothetical protein